MKKEAGTKRKQRGGAAADELTQLITELTAQMHAAAAELHFEVAARYRDEIGDLKKELRALTENAAPSKGKAG